MKEAEKKQATSTSCQQLQVPPAKKKKTTTTPMEKLLGEIFSKESCDESRSSLFREIALYKSEPAIKLDSNPLEWWFQREHLYLLITKLVKQYFSVPGTTCSVPSERLFSSADAVISAKINSLKLDNANKIFFFWKTVTFSCNSDFQCCLT